MDELKKLKSQLKALFNWSWQIVESIFASQMKNQSSAGPIRKLGLSKLIKINQESLLSDYITFQIL